MKPKKIKIAILSCIHGHAPGYFSLVNSDYYELVAVSTVPDADRICMSYTDIPDVPRYSSDEELYENHPELEAVIIGSENKNHYKQFMEAARRGLHIFSMKVPTLDMREYAEMLEAEKKYGIVCQIEMELRRYASIWRARELVQNGSIGELQSIGITNYSHNPVWWCPWQCDPELSYGKAVPLRPNDPRFRGGALTDHVHPFYLMRLITGSEFDTVYGNVTPNIRDGVRTEDMIRLMGTLKNGAVFSIDPSYANDEKHYTELLTHADDIGAYIYPKPVEVFMTAVGSKGTIICDLYGKDSFVQIDDDHHLFCESWAFDAAGIINSEKLGFYRAIREGVPPTATLEDHLKTIKAVVACYESVSTGKIVKVI